MNKRSDQAFSKNLVSIIIPTYNYGRYLRQAIESAISQSYRLIEVIVVDDGSTDDTASICKSYPIRYYFQSNQGVSAAMNAGIKLSRGKFYITMGADDILEKDYVEKTLYIMLTNGKIGFVYTGARLFGEINAVILPIKLYHRLSILVGGWVGVIGAALVRKAAFESVGGFDVTFPAYEDLDFLIRVSLKGWKSRAIYEPLYLYRRHSSDIPHRHPDYNTSKDRYCRDLIDSKYWFARPYKKIRWIYKLLFERFFFLALNPIEYFKGTRRIYRIRSYAKMIKQHNFSNSKKALDLTLAIAGEAYELMSARVGREQILYMYYEQRITKMST